MVNGQLLQMNKSWGQLKNRQQSKISEWMYNAYKKQVDEGLSNEEALSIVLDKIDDAKIWIPHYEVEKKYYANKTKYGKRLELERVPQHIKDMEAILDKATAKLDAMEKKITEYEEFQSEIQKLEAYYTSQQWKDDVDADEKGQFPKKMKRGVLSQDGIYNLLERNKEMLNRIGQEVGE